MDLCVRKRFPHSRGITDVAWVLLSSSHSHGFIICSNHISVQYTKDKSNK